MIVKIACAYSELKDPSLLLPSSKNPNVHSEAQIERLAKLIEYYGFRHPIVVSKNSGFIVAGHGRWMAATKLGLSEVPVDYQEFDTPDAEYSFMVADNAVALWSELDLASINAEMINLGPDFDVDLFGIEDFKIDLNEFENNPEGTPEGDKLYTDKIQIPIYEPTGKKPEINELYQDEKTIALIDQINSSTILEETKAFLRKAAQRHTVINFQNVAEYYAHADKETQELFEASALVIIDFNKAIEQGLTELANEISDAI